jgi:hypothetical protein
MVIAKNAIVAGESIKRVIGVRTQNVRGQIAKNQEYESLMERDFLTLLRFDRTIESFVTQSITLPYSLNQKSRTYTPDVLVKYKPDGRGHTRKITLYEVKPEEYADHPDDELAAKFAAANLYCADRGWLFEVVTEPDIYTPRLKNVEFLLRFLDRACDPGHVKLLLDQLRQWNGCATPHVLLAGIYRSPESRALLLPDLWGMVAQGIVHTDLDVALTMRSEIWEIEA